MQHNPGEESRLLRRCRQRWVGHRHPPGKIQDVKKRGAEEDKLQDWGSRKQRAKPQRRRNADQQKPRYASDQEGK